MGKILLVAQTRLLSYEAVRSRADMDTAKG